MKNLSIYILFFLLTDFVYAQNLVPVPQFEKNDTAICAPPTITGIVVDVLPWFEYGSADYFNVCDTSKYVGVPQNFIGYQAAHSGRGYVGIVAYVSTMSLAGEYIEAPLLSNLVAGQTYYVQFYVSLGGISRYAIQNIGLLFTDTLYDPSYYVSNNITVYPQIVGTTMLNDSINWVAVNGSFVASGGEQYITIGNFYTNAETISQYLGGSGSINLEAYYYIDDVYVGATPPPVSVGEIKNERDIKLYPNPNHGLMTLDCDLKDGESGALTIYDLTGRLMKTYVIQNEAKLINVDAKFLQSGIYLYEIVVNSKTVKKDKLIIFK